MNSDLIRVEPPELQAHMSLFDMVCNCTPMFSPILTSRKASVSLGPTALSVNRPQRVFALAAPRCTHGGGAQGREKQPRVGGYRVRPPGGKGSPGSCGAASQRGQREERQRSTIPLAGAAPVYLKPLFLTEKIGASCTKRARRF